MDKAVILFDGVCNLCNGAVNFVIKRDKKSAFKFGTLQSAKAKELLNGKSYNGKDLSSFVLIENGQIYFASSAALRVCRHLSGGWPILYGFIIVPKFIRDWVYNFISNNRYKWFGKTEACMIPTKELMSKFLEQQP